MAVDQRGIEPPTFSLQMRRSTTELLALCKAMYHTSCIESVARPLLSVMRSSISISKYNLWVIGLYVVLFPLVAVYMPNVLKYNFSSDSLAQVWLIIGG